MISKDIFAMETRLIDDDKIRNEDYYNDRFFVLVTTILATCLFSVTSYPTLEGWVLWRYYSEYGINWYIDNLPSQCVRPLHLIPSLIAWFIPGRYDISCMALGGFLTLFRAGLSIAIARSLNTSRSSGIIFFLVCVVQPFWPAAGYERFHAAQTSFVLYLFALYLCCGTRKPANYRNVAIGIIFSLSCFMTYQGLFLVSIATPMLFIIFHSRSMALKTAFVFLPSCIIYFVFQKVIVQYFPEPIEPSNNHRITMTSITRIYTTVLNSGIFTLLSILSAFIFMIFQSIQQRESIRKQIFIFLELALTPLSAIIFYSSLQKLNDPDRVMFPIMASIAVVILSACKSCSKSTQQANALWINFPCRLVFCCSFLAFTCEILRFILLQNALLHQLSERSHLFNKDSSVQLVDNTGIFGDVYTFLPPQISYATSCYGIHGKFEICTPQSVSKIHNYAKRYPIKTTPLCETLSPANYTLFLKIDHGTTTTLFGKSIVVHE